jgi:DNA-binding CsgD family transcriptional regulator
MHSMRGSMGGQMPKELFADVFQDVIEDIDDLNSLVDLELYVKKLLQPYGIRHAVYHAINIPGIDRLNPVVALTYDKNWLKHYIKEDYVQIDPVVAAAATSLLPIDWETLDKSQKRIKKLFDESYDAGVGKRGLSLPIRGANGDRAVFSITSDASDKDWTVLKKIYMRDFQVIANFIHVRAIKILGIDFKEKFIVLNDRERECLQWAAMGKKSHEIASITNFSERSVRFFLDSARFKLNCVNRTQTVAKAAALQIIVI